MSTNAYIVEEKIMEKTKNPRNIEVKNQGVKCKN